jgi:UDP-N-acetylmuramoyl-L-alanyl-D-glutamate--2,6-diaminopimelate ligase
VIGITGTTGKTTSVYLIAKMLAAAGYKVGFTSTAVFNNGIKEWLNDKKMTMVGRLFTQKLLRQMVTNGCQYAIVETTSEGIKQYRHRFINYDILVFTGLYPEHIEAHGNFANYQKTKGQLFEHLKRCQQKYINDNKKVIRLVSNLKKIELNRVKKTLVINGDDEQANYFLDFRAEEKIVYTSNENHNYKNNNLKVVIYKNVVSGAAGVSFSINKTKINLQLLGRFNAQNAMAAGY